MLKKTNHLHRHKGLIERVTDMSYGALFSAWLVCCIVAACIYFALSYVPGNGPEPLSHLPTVERFWDSLYFSFVTAASVGYGDITPFGFSKIIASIQSVVTLALFGIFISKLASFKGENAQREMHRLTFENIFHNTREGLFIIRKDFDRIIQDVEHNHPLPDHVWENLTVAYIQAQALLREIPDFYAAEIDLYTLDATREKLLTEGVHRTLQRINELLETLTNHGIDWSAHHRSFGELLELLHIADASMHLWQERSPHERTQAFTDIMELKERVHAQVSKTGKERT